MPLRPCVAMEIAGADLACHCADFVRSIAERDALRDW
jgi:hypothetical protein